MRDPKDILGLRSTPRTPDEDDADPRYYNAFDANRNGRPVMGIDLVFKNGAHKGCWYFEIKFPEYTVGDDGEEIVSFLVPPRVVMISGKGIKPIYDHIMRNTLKSIHEYDGRPVREGGAIVHILDLAGPDPLKRADERVGPKLEVVTPGKKLM